MVHTTEIHVVEPQRDLDVKSKADSKTCHELVEDGGIEYHSVKTGLLLVITTDQ